MRNNGIALLILGCSILLQCFCMRNSPIFEHELPFLTGFTSADSMAGNLLLTFYSIMPIPFLLMFFSGGAGDMVNGYGKLLIIRNYSRQKILFRLLIKTGVLVAGIVLFTGIVFTLARTEDWGAIGVQAGAKGLGLYTLTLTAIVFLQYYLELYIEAQHANVIVIIGTTVALLGSGSLATQIRGINILLFPGLAFAQNNGVLEYTEWVPSYEISLCWILMICTFWGSLCSIGVKKRDIL